MELRTLCKGYISLNLCILWVQRVLLKIYQRLWNQLWPWKLRYTTAWFHTRPFWVQTPQAWPNFGSILNSNLANKIHESIFWRCYYPVWFSQDFDNEKSIWEEENITYSHISKEKQMRFHLIWELWQTKNQNKQIHRDTYHHWSYNETHRNFC